MALTYLLLCSHPDHGGRLRDGIDMALAMGAFDLPLQLIFAGEAVLALQPGWDAGHSGEGDYLSQLGALPLYEIATPWVCAASLARYGLTSQQLRIPVEERNAAELTALAPLLLY